MSLITNAMQSAAQFTATHRTALSLSTTSPVAGSAPPSVGPHSPDEVSPDRGRSWLRYLSGPNIALTNAFCILAALALCRLLHPARAVLGGFYVGLVMAVCSASWIGTRYTKINPGVENAVRQVFTSAICADRDQFTTAMAMLTAKGERFAREAVDLAVAVGSSALADIHGERPRDWRLHYLADRFVDSEAWAAIDENAARAFFVALADRAPATVVLRQSGWPELTFLAGGWLLLSFLAGDDRWDDFLDDLLQGIERECR